MEKLPTRDAGLARLQAFIPAMGRSYVTGRNYDRGPGRNEAVSGLSPYVRHRLVTEAELIGAAIAQHGPRIAEKFVQEVFWRTYWKGWLELRPAVWAHYRSQLDAALAAMAEDEALRHRMDAATDGRTGIECFDAWVAELRTHGVLHNHTRMWFASIWCFTLRLPWLLGADFFLRHLIDGDPATNTLSWRWVLGSQTKGRAYVARVGNIARYTGGRFNPEAELDEDPRPVIEPAPDNAGTLPPQSAPPSGRAVLLLHEDDLNPESLDIGGAEIAAVAGYASPRRRSPLGCADNVSDWVNAALDDGVSRAGRHFGVPASVLRADAVAGWAAASGTQSVLTPWAPVGWAGDALADVERALHEQDMTLHRIRRPWDSVCWPLATRGYFNFRTAIPGLLDTLSKVPA